MEVLFKDDECLYYILYDSLNYHYLSDKPNVDKPNVKHLDEVEVLYYYRNIQGNLFPVYYEHGDCFITKDGYLYYISIIKNKTRDYTTMNLKLI